MKVLKQRIVTLLLMGTMLLAVGCANEANETPSTDINSSILIEGESEMLDETHTEEIEIAETEGTQVDETETEGNVVDEAEIGVESEMTETGAGETEVETETETKVDTDVTVDKVEQSPSSELEYGVTFTDCSNTKYATASLNVRTEPNANSTKVGALIYAEEVKEIGIGDNGWSKIEYKGEIRYVNASYLTDEKPTIPETVPATSYPLTYSDDTCTITIAKEWYENAWCYIAHLQFTDYNRFGTACANNRWVSYETTSHMAERIGAVFAVNGPYMVNKYDHAIYEIVRSGSIFSDLLINTNSGCYNKNTGIFGSSVSLGLDGMLSSTAVSEGLLTDSMCFYNTTLILNGEVVPHSSTDRAQRTFIGTNGNPGDIYIVVSEGRKVDGESSGLTFTQESNLMLKLGCTYAINLDGGGSSTMYFNGMVLNSANGNERAVVDFVYLK